MGGQWPTVNAHSWVSSTGVTPGAATNSAPAFDLYQRVTLREGLDAVKYLDGHGDGKQRS